jgi:hypothetical protein
MESVDGISRHIKATAEIEVPNATAPHHSSPHLLTQPLLVQSNKNYHNSNSRNTTTATNTTKMPGKHAKSHIFNTRMRKVNKRGRGGPRIMSMASLMTRLM